MLQYRDLDSEISLNSFYKYTLPGATCGTRYLTRENTASIAAVQPSQDMMNIEQFWHCTVSMSSHYGTRCSVQYQSEVPANYNLTCGSAAVGILPFYCIG
jgi:hypothetical protein